jgi:predicted TIM-barrel fold metal-dependent hydrolase
VTTETVVKTVVIDGDGHVLEPGDLWQRELPEKLRPLGFRIFDDPGTGGQGMLLENALIIRPPSIGAIAAARWPREKRLTRGAGYTYEQSPAAGFNPKDRLAELDREGVDVAVLYPTLGLFLGSITNRELAVASCRIYNDWLADYCSAAPERLVGIAALPLQDPLAAVKEAERAVGELGFRGVFVLPTGYNQYFVDSPEWEPVWSAVEEMGVPVGIHPSGKPASYGAADFYSRRGNVPGMFKIIVFLFDNYYAFSSMVGHGVLERHPKLKVLVLESGGGWLPHWLDQMDHWRQITPYETGHLSLLPSEYFRRQCYISADPDEKALPFILEIAGDDKVIWASDYPHTDVTAPDVVAEIREHIAGLPEGTQRRILGENAARIYGLKV